MCAPCAQEYLLPSNVQATTSLEEAIDGAQYAIHAVPVQHSRKFLESIAVRTPASCPSVMQPSIFTDLLIGDI